MADDVVHENQPGGTYKHWEPSLNRSIWRLEWTPPHNNPFTPEGWNKVIDYWAGAGIDVSDVPPISTPDPENPTYPYGVPLPGGGWSPGASADPTPLTEDPNPPPLATGPGPNGEGGSGSSAIGLAVAGLAAVIILGGFK